MVKELARMLIESLSRQASTTENREPLRKLLAQLRQQHPSIFSEASSDAVNKSDEDHRAKIEQLILSLCVVSVTVAHVEYFFTLPDADEPESSPVNLDGEQSCGPYTRIYGLGSRYARGGGEGFIRK